MPALGQGHTYTWVIHGYHLHFPTGLKIDDKIKGVGKIDGEKTFFGLNCQLFLFPAYVSHCKTVKHGPEPFAWSPKEVQEMITQVRLCGNKQEQQC